MIVVDYRILMTHKLRSLFYLLVLLLCCISLQGQESQFSQFLANPLYLNPALTGSHSGSFRIMSNYRNQWSGPLDKPFTTSSFGGDVKYDLKNSGSYASGNDIVAVGMQFFSDRVALLDYNTTQLSLTAAFHKILSKPSNQYLSLGLQLGLAQRGISYENLSFQDQFNGVDQYNQATRENLPANSVVTPDLSLGLHYSITPQKNNSYYLGIAYHHLNSPNISFFDRDQQTTEEYEAFNLKPRFTAHVGASYPYGDFTSIEPRAVFISQGIAQSFVLGSNLRYELNKTDGIDVHIGAWMRTNRGLTTWQPSDVILSAGFGKGGLLIGLSYDANILGLSANTFGANTIEISISYTGNHDNESRICPAF